MWNENLSPSEIMDRLGWSDKEGEEAIREVRGAVMALCQHVQALKRRPDPAPLVEALQSIIDINGSTGGPEALVAEFKHVASTALAKYGKDA